MGSKLVFKLGEVLIKTELAGDATAAPGSHHERPEAEFIILRKTAKFWNRRNWYERPDGVLLVTNHRLAFCADFALPGGATFLSFPFGLIENLRTTRVMFISPAVEFEARGSVFTFTFFSNAREVFDAVKSAAGRRG